MSVCSAGLSTHKLGAQEAKHSEVHATAAARETQMKQLEVQIERLRERNAELEAAVHEIKKRQA